MVAKTRAATWSPPTPGRSSTRWPAGPRSRTARSAPPATAWAVGCRSPRPGTTRTGSVAAASFHGGNLAARATRTARTVLADRIGATVYVAAAENDGSFPAEQYDRLEKSLTAAGVPHTLETYPAAHGFAVPDNPTYDAAARSGTGPRSSSSTPTALLRLISRQRAGSVVT